MNDLVTPAMVRGFIKFAEQDAGPRSKVSPDGILIAEALRIVCVSWLDHYEERHGG